MNFEVEYFKKADGSQPAEAFMLGQETKMQAKLFRGLELLESRGNELREPYSSHLVDEFYELRAMQSNDICRIRYFFVIGRKIILTHGFTKKTQKTPLSEIKLAKKYQNEYFGRKEN